VSVKDNQFKYDILDILYRKLLLKDFKDQYPEEIEFKHAIKNRVNKLNKSIRLLDDLKEEPGVVYVIISKYNKC